MFTQGLTFFNWSLLKAVKEKSAAGRRRGKVSVASEGVYCLGVVDTLEVKIPRERRNNNATRYSVEGTSGCVFLVSGMNEFYRFPLT